MRHLSRLALLVACLSAPAWARAACSLQAIELPIAMVGARAVITVGINGKDVPLTVDSGAFFSFLTEGIAQQLQLPLSYLPFGMRVDGVTGRVDAQKTVVKQLRILDSQIPNVDFLVGGNEPGSGTVGLLGRNVLSMMDAEYDLAHGVIRLVAPGAECRDSNMAYWAGKTPVSELELEDQRKSKLPPLIADARINGKTLRVLFDTGATSTITLAAAHRAGIQDADLTLVGESHGAGRGKARVWTTAVARFEVGGETIANNKLLVGDFDIDEADMLLGIDFFLSHRIYVSKRQQKMFFTYNGGTVFAMNAAAAASDPGSGPDARPGMGEPVDAAGFARRGAAHLARGQKEQALADLDRACEMAPQDAGHFAVRARIHESLKQWTDALRDMNTALQLDPGQADARMRRAFLRASLAGDTAAQQLAGEGASKQDGVKEATKDLQVLSDTLPAQSNMRRDMATLYSRFGLSDRALSEWNQWLTSHPTDIARADALNSRCWTRMLLGVDLDKALADCEDAIDMQPKNAQFLDSRAWVRLKRGELKASVADFDRALGIDPKQAWSFYGRGTAKAKLGSASDGNPDLDAARKLRPTIDDDARRLGLSTQPAGPAPT